MATWMNTTKNSASWSNQTKNANTVGSAGGTILAGTLTGFIAPVTYATEHTIGGGVSSIWSNTTKNSASWSNATKN